MAVNASEKLLAEPDRVRRIGDIHESMRNADAAHEATHPRAFGQLANLDVSDDCDDPLPGRKPMSGKAIASTIRHSDD